MTPDILVLMRTMAVNVKNPLADALTSTTTMSATLVKFGPALLQVPGPKGRQAISTMATCVGRRKWSPPELSKILESCWCFDDQFWPQDNPQPPERA